MDEQKIIEMNNAYIQQQVTLFRERCSTRNPSAILDREDLVQEVTLAFLLTVRQHGEEEARRHVRDYLHAMFEQTRMAYVVHMPYYAFRTKRKPLLVKTLDDVAGRLAAPSMEEQVDSRVDAEATYTSLSAFDKELLLLRMDGFTQTEIAQRIGRKQVWVSRRLKKIMAAFQ